MRLKEKKRVELGDEQDNLGFALFPVELSNGTRIIFEFYWIKYTWMKYKAIEFDGWYQPHIVNRVDWVQTEVYQKEK